MADIVENLASKTKNLEIDPKFKKWDDLPPEVRSEYLKSIEAAKSSPASDSIVKPDIGGTVFKTSRSTLTKFDGFFKTMLETDIPMTKDESGAIFIDRSAKHFDKILNFMRDGHVELPEQIGKVRELFVEAQYYLLTGLVQLCNVVFYNEKWSKMMSFGRHDNVKINVGGTLFENTKFRWTFNASKIKEMLEGREPRSLVMSTEQPIVKLNIGGTVFQTSKSTLTKFDGFFKTMLETDIPMTKDESGASFIDRPAKHFELILNYMRDGFVIIPESKTDIQEIQIEAQYYLLDGLVELCATKISVPNDIVKLNIGGTIFQTTKDTLTRNNGTSKC